MKTLKIATAITLAAALVSCTAAQQKTVNTGVAAVTAACMDVAPLANAALLVPVAAPVAVYVTAACQDATTIAKIAADPTTVEWLAGLKSQLIALMPVNLQTVPASKPAASM